MLGLAFSTAVLAIIVIAMEDDFDSWMPLVACALLMGLASFGGAVGADELGLGPMWVIAASGIASTLVGCVALSFFFGMEIQRAAKAASIWFSVVVSANLGLSMLMA